MPLQTKSTQKESLGSLLKQTRLSFGYQLSTISQKIKIAEKYLAALENDDYHRLPGPAYTKGFLRHYADFLGLETEEVINLYKKESFFFEIKQQVLKQPARKKTLLSPVFASKNNLKINASPRLHLLQPQKISNSNLQKTIGLVMALALIFYFAWVVSQTFLPPRIKIITPINNLETANQQIQIKGWAEKGAVVKINNQSVTNLNGNEFEETLSLLPGFNNIKISAQKKNGPEAVVWRQIFVKE